MRLRDDIDRDTNNKKLPEKLRFPWPAAAELGRIR